MAQTRKITNRKRTNGRRPNKKGKRTLKQKGGVNFGPLGEYDVRKGLGKMTGDEDRFKKDRGMVTGVQTAATKAKDSVKNVVTNVGKNMNRAVQHRRGYPAYGEIKEFTGYDTEREHFTDYNNDVYERLKGKTIGEWDQDYTYMNILGTLSIKDFQTIDDAKIGKFNILDGSMIVPRFKDKHLYIIKNENDIESHYKTLNQMNEAYKLYKEKEKFHSGNKEIETLFENFTNNLIDLGEYDEYQNIISKMKLNDVVPRPGAAAVGAKPGSDDASVSNKSDTLNVRKIIGNPEQRALKKAAILSQNLKKKVQESKQQEETEELIKQKEAELEDTYEKLGEGFKDEQGNMTSFKAKVQETRARIEKAKEDLKNHPNKEDLNKLLNVIQENIEGMIKKGEKIEELISKGDKQTENDKTEIDNLQNEIQQTLEDNDVNIEKANKLRQQ